MSDYTIGNGTLLNIANAIRAQEGSSSPIQVSDFANRIANFHLSTSKTGDISNQNTEFYGITANSISSIGNAIKAWDELTGPVSGFAQRILNLNRTWHRPSTWPNYNYIDRTNADAIYFTVDTRESSEDYFRIDYRCWDSADSNNSTVIATIERGYIDSSGFHAVSTDTNMNSPYSTLVPTNEGDYVVYKVTPINTTKKLASVGVRTDCTAKIVEIWGRAQHLHQFWKVSKATDLISFDVLLEGYTSMPNHIIKELKFGSSVNFTNVIENINFDGINWNNIIAYSGNAVNVTPFYDALYLYQLLIGVNYIDSIDLTPYANSTIYFYTQAMPPSFCFSYMSSLKDFTVPTLTLNFGNGLDNFSNVFYGDTNLEGNSGVLDLSNVTIIFQHTNGYISIDNWFYMCTKLNTIYLPNFTFAINNRCRWRYTFFTIPNVTEIYNVPDLYYRDSSSSTFPINSVYFTGSTSLSRATMLRFFNAISAKPADTSRTHYSTTNIIISQEVADRLTTADIAILSNKGHTLSVQPT